MNDISTANINLKTIVDDHSASDDISSISKSVHDEPEGPQSDGSEMRESSWMESFRLASKIRYTQQSVSSIIVHDVTPPGASQQPYERQDEYMIHYNTT